MKRRAVLVGINQYQSIEPLRGCVNDVTNMRFVLKEVAGFENENIRVVANERATKRAIEERLEWLVDGAEAGDLLVLHFACHGAQVRDRDDDDELSDQLDEVLCPWDMNWDDGFITDDYLRDHLTAPDGTVLEVILDSCHSGDGSIEVGLPPSIPLPANPDRQPRFVQPPADIVSRHLGEDLERTQLFRAEMAPSVVRWSACADFQTAADARINQIFNGAFTFYFCKHLREADPGISRLELLRRVRGSLAHNGYTQVPELAAAQSFVNSRPFRI